MASSKIAFLYRNSLLSQGLEAALRGVGGAEVYALDMEVPGAWKRLQSLIPSAVVVDATEMREVILSELQKLLQDGLLDCLVYLNRNDDVVDIMWRKRVRLAKASDLLTAVKEHMKEAPVQPEPQLES